MPKMLNIQFRFLVISATLLALIIISDQIFKHKFRQLGGFYVCNNGISFNMQIPFLFFWLTIGILGLSTYSIRRILKNKHPLLISYEMGLFLIIGGAVSNYIDRLLGGCVIDYISIYPGILPAFNLADVSIFVGCCLVFLKTLPLAQLKVHK